MKKVELISPGGNLEKAKTAFLYGADSVYLGGKKFNLRSRAGNLTFSEIARIIDLSKRLKKNVYLTLNIYFRNSDFRELKTYLGTLLEIGVKNLIISDFGIVTVIHQYFKDKFHLTASTQTNITNYQAAELYRSLGIKRIIPARELTLKEISYIKKKTKMSLETFIHGAMCVSYSGRCLLSEYFTSRSANRGDCSHPCRWEYVLQEKKRRDEYLPVEEDPRGSLILSSKDLCMIEDIPKMIEAGIDAFKIEGRMKSLYYVANVTRVYRDAIDAHYNKQKKKLSFWKRELDAVSHRTFFKGFYFGYDHQSLCAEKTYKRQYRFVGYIKEKIGHEIYSVCFKNSLKKDDKLESILPNMKNIDLDEFVILDKGFQIVKEAKISDRFYLKTPEDLEPYAILRVSNQDL
ncbi:MAG: U32 family peptidase C-terminal domain-containing protein [Spirochaetes bacterium]|nr:U32 family peptidase C-terminal domain-containing protein [Spirochaetota bacterium]